MERLQVDSQPAVQVSQVSRPQLKVTYVFAGHRRRADVREHLEALAVKRGFELVMHEVDLASEDQDVLDESFWCELLRFIRNFRPFCIIATHLAPHTAEQGIFTSEFLAQDQLGPESTLMDFRGSLQRNYSKPHRAQRLQIRLGSWPIWMSWMQLFSPNSRKIWGRQIQGYQHHCGRQKISDYLARKNMKTFALFQCEFGAQTPKPTRFLSDLDHFYWKILFGGTRIL